MSSDADLPDDVATLQALLSEALASIADRDREIERLKVQIDKLKRMHFGRKSEQLDQLETQLEDLAIGQGAADVRRARAISKFRHLRAGAQGSSATPPATRRSRARTRFDMPQVRQRHARAWRRRVRAVGARHRYVQGNPHDSTQDGLPQLRSHRTAADAGAADRAQHGASASELAR